MAVLPLAPRLVPAPALFSVLPLAGGGFLRPTKEGGGRRERSPRRELKHRWWEHPTPRRKQAEGELFDDLQQQVDAVGDYAVYADLDQFAHLVRVVDGPDVHL